MRHKKSKVIEIDKFQTLVTQKVLSLFSIPVGISSMPNLMYELCLKALRPHTYPCYLCAYQKWYILSILIWYFALQEKNKVEIFSIAHNTKLTVNDYPACVNAVTAYPLNYNWVAFEVSGPPMPLLKHPTLNNAFNTLLKCKWGETPDNPSSCSNLECKHYNKFANNKKCRNILGNCAEQKGANDILNQGIVSELEKLEFSLAIRPRTMQLTPYCCNCTKLFPQLK